MILIFFQANWQQLPVRIFYKYYKKEKNYWQNRTRNCLSRQPVVEKQRKKLSPSWRRNYDPPPPQPRWRTYKFEMKIIIIRSRNKLVCRHMGKPVFDARSPIELMCTLNDIRRSIGLIRNEKENLEEDYILTAKKHS